MQDSRSRRVYGDRGVPGCLSGYAAWHFGFTLAALGALIYIWAMIALAFIDLDTFYLPDDITLPLLWCGLLFNLPGVFTDVSSAVVGAAAGYLTLWAVFWLFKLATGKEGMGYGDFKLLAAIGAWLGWKVLPLVVVLSSFVGAVVGVLLIVSLAADATADPVRTVSRSGGRDRALSWRCAHAPYSSLLAVPDSMTSASVSRWHRRGKTAATDRSRSSVRVSSTRRDFAE